MLPRLSCPSLTSFMFTSFRRPTLDEQLSFLNFLLFDEVRVWEVLKDCLKGSVRFMCRTRQKHNNLILLSLEQELSSLYSAPLLPQGWEERSSILPSPLCVSRGSFPASVVHPWSCRCPRSFQELVPVSHCKSSQGLGVGLTLYWGCPGPQLGFPHQQLETKPPPHLPPGYPGTTSSATGPPRWLHREATPATLCPCCLVVPSLFLYGFVGFLRGGGRGRVITFLSF